MATPVKEFPGAKHRGIYDWQKWTDGRIWRLEPGVDFKDAKAARNAAWQHGRNHGMKLRTKIDDGCLYVQFTLKEK